MSTHIYNKIYFHSVLYIDIGIFDMVAERQAPALVYEPITIYLRITNLVYNDQVPFYNNL